MGAKTERQHYVPRFHLKQFVDPSSEGLKDPWLWVGSLATGEVKRRSPTNVGWARGIYDGPAGFADRAVKLETFLAQKVESEAARAISALQQTSHGRRPGITPVLSRYVGWLAARSATMYSLYQGWAAEIGEVEVAGRADTQGIAEKRFSFRHPDGRQRGDVRLEEFSNLMQAGWRWHFSAREFSEIVHLQSWTFQTDLFKNLNWLTLRAPRGRFFVIGDRPVAWGFSGKLMCRPAYLRDPRVQLVAPLTRELSLFAYGPGGQCPDAVNVADVNRISAEAASSWIVGPTRNSVLEAMSFRLESHH